MYLYNRLYCCALLSGDTERDLERLQEPEREEEYEYLLLLGGDWDAELERDEEDDELGLLLE